MLAELRYARPIKCNMQCNATEVMHQLQNTFKQSAATVQAISCNCPAKADQPCIHREQLFSKLNILCVVHQLHALEKKYVFCLVF